MNRFAIEDTGLAGLRVIARQATADRRGWFERLFCSEELAAAAGERFAPAQINRSCTLVRGAVRGMHFQYPPHAEVKLVSCLQGEVFDVAVDLRIGSPTFLRWFGVRLSAENRASLLIPRGFAHGFQALEERCELLYLHSAAYAPAHEGGIRPDDPRIAIAWPLPIADMSERDAAHALLGAGFAGVRL
jgi:dTDP-4-dehydrorhamnose 3,5-epimerase